jgi:membrane associated rhomboid family serine protease
MPDALARLPELPAPTLLIGSVVLVSLCGWLLGPLQGALLLRPYRVFSRWELHRLLTAGWVHTDVMHLAVNMLMLHFFAEKVVSALGVSRFLVLYISAVVVGFVPTTLRHRNDPGYGSLGASGAVAGVMFSAILLFPKLKLMPMFVPIPVPGLVFAAAYLAYSAWSSYGARDGVNHGAHFSGAVHGALLTYLFEPARVERTIRAML